MQRHRTNWKQDGTTGYLLELGTRNNGKAGALHTPHGTVEVQTMMRATGPQEGYQVVTFSTVIDGHTYAEWQDRPPSEHLTDRGVKIVAGRWIRTLVEEVRDG